MACGISSKAVPFVGPLDFVLPRRLGYIGGDLSIPLRLLVASLLH